MRERTFRSRTSDREYKTIYTLEPPIAVCQCPGYRTHGHCRHQKEVLKVTTEPGQAIVPYRVQAPTALLPSTAELGMIKAIAETALTGQNLLPKIGDRNMTAGEASVIMLYGRELGVQPLASLSQIHIVKNRPQPSAQLLVGLMQSRDPEAWVEIVERTTESAKVRVHYKKRAQVFPATMEDARRAGLAEGVNWKKYPKQMLVWTAVRTGVRIMAPDAINALAQLPSIEQAGELMAHAETEAYIEGEATDLTEQAQAEPAALTPEGEAEIKAPEPVEQPAAPTPEAKPEPAAPSESPRQRFEAFCFGLQFKNAAQVARYLDIRDDDCEDPVQRHWVEPGIQMGLTEEEAFDLAGDVLRECLREAREAKSQGAANPVTQAIAVVKPIEQLIAAGQEAKPKPETPSEDVPVEAAQ